MCPQPKCAKKDVLDALLKHLGIEPSNVDTVEFLTFDAKPTPSHGEVSDDLESEPHDVVRFLHDGKALGSGMFFQVLYMINFWPCR